MSGAAPSGKFQDHYIVLGIDPKADNSTLHQAYQRLANKYHPAKGATPDKEKFESVTLAYEVLADPAARKIFDELRVSADKDKPPEFSGEEFFETIAGEARRRLAILCLLYDRRRERPATGGLSLRHMEQMMQISQEQIQLSVWYLKQRGLVILDDKSNLLITVEGMDYLEAHLPPAESILALLRATTAQADEAAEEPDPPAPVAAEPSPVPQVTPAPPTAAPAPPPANPAPQPPVSAWRQARQQAEARRNDKAHHSKG